MDQLYDFFDKTGKKELHGTLQVEAEPVLIFSDEGFQLTLSSEKKLEKRLIHYARWTIEQQERSSFRIFFFDKKTDEIVFARELVLECRGSREVDLTVEPKLPYKEVVLNSAFSSELIERFPDVVFITEPEPIDEEEQGPRIIYANQSFEKVTGYPISEALGSHPRFLQGSDTTKESTRNIRKALEAWEPVVQEIVNYKKNGERFVSELSIFPIKDKTGWYTHWISFQRDMTSLRKRLDDHRRSENFLGKLQSVGKIGCWELDLKTGETTWTDEIYQIYGIPSDTPTNEMQGLSFYDPEDQQKLAEGLQRTRETGEIFRGDYRFTDAQGARKWVRVYGELVRGNTGEDGQIIGTMQDISDLKSAEAQLKEFARDIEFVDQEVDTHAIIAKTDAKGRITYVNKNFEDISGYSEAELLGKTHSIVNSGFHSKEFFTHLWKTISSGSYWRGDIKNRRKDGSSYWVDTTIAPKRGSDGKIAEYISFRYDISSRKFSQDVVREVSSLRKNFIEYSDRPQIFYDHCVDALQELLECEEVLYISLEVDEGASGLRLISAAGELSQKLKGVHILRANHEDTLWEVVETSIQEKKPTVCDGAFDYDFKKQSLSSYNSLTLPLVYMGRVHGLFLSLNRRTGFDQNVLKSLESFCAVAGDLIGKKLSEEILAKQKIELDLLLENTEFAVWDYDPVNNRLHWDSGMFDLYQVDPSHFSGAFDAWEKTLHPEDLERSKLEFQESLSSNRFDSEFRIITQAGKIKFIRAKAHVATDENGKAVRVTGVNWDVTEERARMEASLERQKAEEHQSRLASIGELASGVGHEINNPLTIAVAAMEKIKSQLPVDSSDVKKLDESLSRIAKIVSGLRSFAREDDEEEPFDLIEVARESVALLQGIYEKQKVKLLLELSPEVSSDSVPLICASRGRVQQVIMNLISNAKDATEGQLKRTLLMCLDATKDKVLLKVRDNGHGIEPKNLNKIFHSFYTTKPVGKGTGIGLSIVSKIVKDSGGEISVKSVVGEGSTFTVSFPRVQESVRVLPQGGADMLSESQNIDELGDLKGIRILVVDDEEGVRDYLTDILEEAHAEVSTATSAEEALGQLQKPGFVVDAIITDVQLGGMSGIELIQRFRALFPEAQTKCLISTGGVNLDLENPAPEVAQLMDAYLYKPYRPAGVVSAVTHLFKNQEG